MERTPPGVRLNNFPEVRCYNSPVSKKPHTEDHLQELRTRITKAPQEPGIYRWINAEGDVLYVGKAKNLKNRLKSYVQKKPDLAIGPWKLALREALADIDWTVTETELEALILETNLIKELKPKYNVLMKDDKNYVYVRISIKDPYPTVSIIRRIEDDKAKYFGPFLSAHHIHRTLDMLHDVYGWRACDRSTDLLNKAEHASRRPAVSSRVAQGQEAESVSRDGGAPQHDTLKPCLDFQIGKCNGLCAGKITQEEYRQRIEAMMRFFKGDRGDVLHRLREKMQKTAERKLFEEAAKLRDTLSYIESLEEQQVVADTSGANTDYFGVALLAGRSHVVILREREGKLMGERSYALAGHADTEGEVLGQFIPQYYIATEEIPDTIICAEAPEEQETLEQWLNQTRQTKKRTTIHVPERGKKSKLLTMAERNAEEKIKQQLARWEAATEKVETALEELRDTLDLPEKPHRIECYDISHLGGTETVGSMVVFVDGKAKNSDYRSFTLRTIHKGEIDDYKALKEVLRRRLKYLVEDLRKEESEWKEHGVSIGKPWKKDTDTLSAIIERHPEKFSTLEKEKKYGVLRKEENIIGILELIHHGKDTVEMHSPWIEESAESEKLSDFFVRKTLSGQKKGKIYIVIPVEHEEYYARIGFRYVIDPPELLQNSLTEGKILMVYIAKDHKADPSLNAKPDLLVLDGGKGQLAVGIELLKNMKLRIPIVSLAKREEEVFVPGNQNSMPFPEDSEGRFLLMRLRDEAHRFANRHREKRLKHSLYME